MNRGYYNTGAPFLCSGGEAVGPGMDCLQLRQPPGPFHYLISEQAKSLVALQELQHEVGALLEFRDLVIETFPNLRTKLAASSTPATMMTTSSSSSPTSSNHHHHHQNNLNNVNNLSTTSTPLSIRTSTDWTPGVRVRKKITNNTKDDTRINNKKSGDITTVQDSGFSTETSSKETHSASSTSAPSTSNAAVAADETEDELWNLLDVIHRKGTRLKDEVEALQGALRDNVHNENDFQHVLFEASADDIRQLRHERDLLLDRLAEMEAEVLAGRVHTSRLQNDLENLLITKHDLEEQLKAVVTQRGEVNSRIHDLHLQFVTKTNSNNSDSNHSQSPPITYNHNNNNNKVLNISEFNNKDSIIASTTNTTATASSHLRTFKENNHKSVLDDVFGDKIPKIKVPDSKKIAAILKEKDPIILKKHLLCTTVQNQVLHQRLDTAERVEIGLAEKLDKVKEENDELRFQLEDKKIELEGTRARVRMLENLQKSLNITSPDIIPTLDSTTNNPEPPLSRTEITTASMKQMSPIPMNLQIDHSSSTESAHDQAENNRKSNDVKRKPSKIPLKSYTAPKPPLGNANNGGGKHSPAPGARSRSNGESPHRPHSAQSWRNNRSEGNSLTTGGKGGGNTSSSLSKSRNGSLVSAKDSFSSKLRSSDSLSKLNTNNSFGTTTNNNNQTNNNSSLRGTLRKNATTKWTNNNKDGIVTSTTTTSSSSSSTTASVNNQDKINSSFSKEKSLYPWTLSSFNSIGDFDGTYPDSLQQPRTTETTTGTGTSSGTQSVQTFLWNSDSRSHHHHQQQIEYYDSIDSNLISSLYQHGEDLAECDSLERQLSDCSDKK